jgi:hypothetical protein
MYEDDASPSFRGFVENSGGTFEKQSTQANSGGKVKKQSTQAGNLRSRVLR